MGRAPYTSRGCGQGSSGVNYPAAPLRAFMHASLVDLFRAGVKRPAIIPIFMGIPFGFGLVGPPGNGPGAGCYQRAQRITPALFPRRVLYSADTRHKVTGVAAIRNDRSFQGLGRANGPGPCL